MAPALADAPSISIPHSSQDSEILNQVNDALHSVGYEQLKRIRVHCHHGRVILQGRISTYFLKQLAQEAIRPICDVREIVNALQVVDARSTHA